VSDPPLSPLLYLFSVEERQRAWLQWQFGFVSSHLFDVDRNYFVLLPGIIHLCFAFIRTSFTWAIFRPLLRSYFTLIRFLNCRVETDFIARMHTESFYRHFFLFRLNSGLLYLPRPRLGHKPPGCRDKRHLLLKSSLGLSFIQWNVRIAPHYILQVVNSISNLIKCRVHLLHQLYLHFICLPTLFDDLSPPLSDPFA